MSPDFFKNQTRSSDTPESSYAGRRAAQWLLALPEEALLLDAAFFRCVQWICGDLRSLLERVERQTAKLGSKAGLAAHHAVREVLDGDPHHDVSGCSVLVEEHPCVCSFVREQIQQLFRQTAEEKNVSLPSCYLSAGNELKRVFGLDEDDIALCEFTFLLQQFSALGHYLNTSLGIFHFRSRPLMAQMLSMSQDALSHHIGMLLAFGILERTSDHALSLPRGLRGFWSPESSSAGDAFFSGAFNGELLPLKSFRIPGEELRHVSRMLKKQVDFPVNLLIYGPSGSGRRTFIHSLADVLDMKVLFVDGRRKGGENECRASFLACLRQASREKEVLVVVDRAERLLDAASDTDAAFDLPDRSAFLGRPGQRIVWITDQVEKIAPSIRRLFTYSLHFEALGLHERVEMWRHVMKRQGLSSRFHKESVTDLALKYPVQAEVVQNAVEHASALYPSGHGFYAALERILHAYLALQHGGKFQPEKTHGAVNYFSLSGVCMDGDISAFMERCRRVDTAMRSGRTLQPGCGTMLFYGPPGTGKTELARFIADTLHRECLVKRASDLFGPFVGMSEQQVAAAFDDMEKSGAVLVIDEADSFLYSRDTVQQSWEITLVNEFLTSLEECRGFCICTTNRMEQLDKAALRRFSHKVKFRYADGAQAEALYSALLAPLCRDAMTEPLRQKLVSMQFLAPGDFHAVRAKYNPLFTRPEDVSHDLLVQALAHEMELKLDTKKTL